MESQSPALISRSAGLVDGLLRGSYGTGPTRAPNEVISMRDAVPIAIALAAFYGLCMGLGVGFETAVMDMLKIPLVLFLAAIICLPSFYVFAALTGAPLKASESARSLAACALFTSVVWAALAPVTGFFTISTTPSSDFIVGLHGVVLALGLLVGVIFLGREITRRKVADGESQIDETTNEAPRHRRRAGADGTVSLGFFLVWLIVFSCVLCQLFVDFSPFLEKGPFVNPEPRFFLDLSEPNVGR